MAAFGIRHIPANYTNTSVHATAAANWQRILGSLHVSKPTHWLESRFHFSFANYFNPKNMSFGALRVMNDDLVTAGDGFGTHGHRDAEIFSYILDGELSHRDSMGNQESLGRGNVQYLSAGSGISHSEMNDGHERCRFIQVWITPDKKGHKPQYGSTVYKPQDRHNKLLHLLGGTGELPAWDKLTPPAKVKLHQDCNVVVSESDAGEKFSIPLRKGRQMYALCMEGSLGVNDTKLQQRDAAEVVADGGDLPVELAVDDSGAHFMLIEMQQG